MEPIVHGLEEEHQDRIDFLYIDREDPVNAEIVNKYSITTQPIFILLNTEGEEVNRWYGPIDPVVFEEAFDAVAIN